MRAILGSFAFGFTLPLRSARLILTRPSLLFWSIVPILLTLAVYGFVLATLQGQIESVLLATVTRWGWDPQGWAAFSLNLVSQIVLFLIGLLTFTLVVGVLAAPFNDFLAERAERWSTPPLPAVYPPTTLLSRAQLRLLAIDVAKTVVATSCSVAALLISWIPVLNLFSATAVFLLICFQFISYPQTRRGFGVADGFQFLRRHFFGCLGFGAATAFLFAIPFISVFFLPVAVVGGTLLVGRAQGTEPFPLK